MRLLLVGGQLQGTEIAYLAKEAGWEVTLVDKREAPLAARLCDEFVNTDIVDIDSRFLKEFDLVFPALEDVETLGICQQMCTRAHVPFAFDTGAYHISSSKAETNRFLASCGVATPPSLDADVGGAEWPCGYIVKPNSESGSVGVERYFTREEALAALKRRPGCIGQAFIEGPVLSIEVVCDHADVRAYVVTEVVVGDDYDCHRVVAPAAVDERTRKTVREAGLCIGRALNMRGIFDVELIMHDGVPYVLEIDARFPSQTPIAIYHATGINLFTETARIFCGDSTAAPARGRVKRHAVLQHVRFANDVSKPRFPELIGECQLKGARPFERTLGIPGAHVGLVARGKDRDALYFTLVSVGDTGSQASGRIKVAISAIERRGAVT